MTNHKKISKNKKLKKGVSEYQYSGSIIDFRDDKESLFDILFKRNKRNKESEKNIIQNRHNNINDNI